MFLIVIRKMLSNKWMLICTLLGSIITVALLSSIPTYTEGIMQRMLIKDLENSQKLKGSFPGGYKIDFKGYYGSEYLEAYKNFQAYDKKITNNIAKSIDLPIITQVTYESTGLLDLISDSGKGVYATIASLSDIENHIKLVNGRMYSKNVENGVHEVILSEESVKVLNVTLGNTYILLNKQTMSSKATAEYKIKVVGIFTYKTLDDPYWYNDIGKLKDNMLMDQGLMNKAFFETGKQLLNTATWYLAYDYHKIKVNNLQSLTDTYKTHNEWMYKNRFNLNSQIASLPIIEKYQERVGQLKTTLIILQIPILVILAFYSFMISKLKIDFESNEIAVMKSRGGSSSLVFGIYLIESFIIGIISLVIGPLLGLYLCKVLGASNGFLEFVQRSALPLHLSFTSYIYSLVAVLFICFSMLIPAFIASKTSIVLYKQKKSRYKSLSFWKKYFLDIILLALAFYGLYSYQRQQKILFMNSMKAADMVIDPLLFIVSVLFIFGCGLLFLRIFPYILRFIFWLGRKIWNPVLYASFLQVSRTTGREQFTMLFIILALSLGIFSANSARTINKNMEEKILYETGSDIVIEGHWQSNQPPLSPSGPPDSATQSSEELYYTEPPFELYKGLSGVQSVTKVFKNNESTAFIGDKYSDKVSIMGIIPNEFGNTAWFRPDLLPYHWYQYLNLLTDAPSAVLVSKAFKEELGAKEGDSISISWGKNRGISGTIYAFVDYWPTLNPNTTNTFFVVANLQHIQNINMVEPYQVWLKKKPETSSNAINKEIIDKKIGIASISDASQKIIINKNDPLLQGTNGALTLNFIVIILITILGFLIYWILSIKSRILQFGIFRAIGLTTKEVIGMIACEQIFITGSSILAGISLGNLTSKIFVPLFQMVYGAETQVPPFKVISDANDYYRLYAIIAFMLILCFFIIGRLINRINISQALKLGED